MATQVTIPIPNANLPVAALLCFLAYTDNPNNPIDYKGKTVSTIEAVVEEMSSIYPLGNVVWSANTQDTVDDNYAFIVCTPSNEYIMAIRGSLPFEGGIDWGVFANWIEEDLNVLLMTQWPYLGDGSNSSATSYVAQGAMDAFTNIQQVPDYMGSGKEAAAFLMSDAVTPGYPVYITGHSLGGNIANTFASFFASVVESAGLSNSNNYLFTFAAPSPGDAEFVSDLATKFPDGQMYQYQISNDIVPLFPVYDTMYNQMAALFPSPGPSAAAITETLTIFGVSYTDTLSNIIQDMATVIYDASVIEGAPYAESTPTVVGYALSTTYEADTLTDWLYQAAYQHTCAHYLFIFWGKATANQAVRILAPRLTKSQSTFLPLS